MIVTCGIDWAEAHHDVALIDETGHRVAKLRIDTGAQGFSELMALLGEHAEQPSAVPVAIETNKGLLVAALRAAGMVVYAINPRAVARYRGRHGQAGGKSDPGDAVVLADILLTDRDRHRPLPAFSDEALAVKALARQHQEAIWARQATVNRLRSLLVDFYPNALAAFPNLTHKAALEVLAAAPTPTTGGKLTLPGRSRRCCADPGAVIAPAWRSGSSPLCGPLRCASPRGSRRPWDMPWPAWSRRSG